MSNNGNKPSNTDKYEIRKGPGTRTENTPSATLLSIKKPPTQKK